MRVRKSYFYSAKIVRDGKCVFRQGSVNAESPLDAIDEIYEMSRKVWKRIILEISIFKPGTGEVLATSNIAEKIGSTGVLPSPIKQAVDSIPYNDKKKAAPMAWLNDNRKPQFMVSAFGTYFSRNTYTTFVGHNK